MNSGSKWSSLLAFTFLALAATIYSAAQDKSPRSLSSRMPTGEALVSALAKLAVSEPARFCKRRPHRISAIAWLA